MTTPRARPRGGRRRVRGTLALLAGLMLTSAVIRLGVGVGEALTREAVAEPVAVAEVSEPRVGPLLEAVRAREERVAEREAALEGRLHALAVAEAQLAAQIEALRIAEDRLAATLALADGAAERDVDRLTAVYEAMKPRDAALLFEEMEASFAAGFLARMHPEAAAAVMAGLEPRTAYTISVILAGRHVGVPTE